MRKILLKLHTGYCGMDTHEGWSVPDTLTTNELDELADERAVEHAETYGIYRLGEDEEESPNTRYSGNNIEGSWVDYIEEKHAGCISFGTSSPEFQEY